MADQRIKMRKFVYLIRTLYVCRTERNLLLNFNDQYQRMSLLSSADMIRNQTVMHTFSATIFCQSNQIQFKGVSSEHPFLGINNPIQDIC